MKKIILIPLLFISYISFSRTYYVKPTGNDITDGKSDATAWQTWKKAFQTAVAGDTVYFRGGVYNITAHSQLAAINNSGSLGTPICFFNYPDEVPILDGSGLIETQTTYPIRAISKVYLHFKGLTIRYFNADPYQYVTGINIEGGDNIIIENCTVHNVDCKGIGIYGCDNTYVINCDVYNIHDNYPEQPGQIGGAFQWQSTLSSYGEAAYDQRIYFEGCRAWNYSDNGFSGQGVGYVEIKNCWAFNGGWQYGSGCGFKMNLKSSGDTINPVSRLIYNCIAANNGCYGWSPNNINGTTYNVNIFNNFSYHNGYNHDLKYWTSSFGNGFVILDYLGSTPAPHEMYANNIAYDNENKSIVAYDNYTHQYNSWDTPPGVTITDADFMSLDWTEMLRPRKNDGSLPVINFGKLAPTSDLIDAGIDVGLPYYGSAPDLGYSEYQPTLPVPVYVSSVIQNATPSELEMIYNVTLANVAPASSAYTVMVNSVIRPVNSVAVSGTKVVLSLASPVVYGDLITVTYTKPASNPLQTSAGGQAVSISTQSVTNNVGAVSPVYMSSVIQNSTPSRLEMIYNVNLANIIPSTSAFTVMVNSIARAVNSISISGTRVLLTLTSPVAYGDIVTVAYTKPATNPLQTSAGGEAATISAQNVTNNVGPVSPVYISSVIENASAANLSIIYNITLANIVPAVSAFTVMVNSVARSVNSVVVSGTKVILTLASPVVYGDIITVAYTRPAVNPLQSTSGGEAATFNAQNVTNNVIPVSPVFIGAVIENAAPSVLEINYSLTLNNIVPSNSSFIVSVNSVNRLVNSVVISGTKVLLTLANPVVYGDIVTVAYNKPAVNPLQATTGGQAVSLSPQNVLNNVEQAIPVCLNSIIQNASPSNLEMIYDLSLASIVPSATSFTVTVNTIPRVVNSVSVSGTRVILNLESPVVYGDVISVSYIKPAINPLQTPGGGQAASIIAQSVNNTVGLEIPVYLSSVIENISPRQLEMTYSLTLANIIPSASSFIVMVNSSIRTVNSVVISGNKVILTLANPVAYADVVTIAYNKPGINPLQTTPGGQAVSLAAQPVINNCLIPPNQSPVINIIKPSDDSSFLSPADIIVEVEAFDPDGTISKIELFNGSIFLGEITIYPYIESYTYLWEDVTDGSYALTAIATDNLNRKTISDAVNIMVTTNQIPLISISSPENNTFVSAPSIIILTADATDIDGTIDKVEYFNWEMKIGESYSAPYTIQFECTNAGTYNITAVALDNLGAMAVSSPLQLFSAIFSENPDSLLLYPNPNDGHFSIILSSSLPSETGNIKIFNVTGETVYTGIMSREENIRHFDLSHSAAGTYILMITLSNKIFTTRKFIKK